MLIGARFIRVQVEIALLTLDPLHSSLKGDQPQFTFRLERTQIEYILHFYLQPSGWRKVRNMVQWTPFIQEFKNRKYQWVQLAGHSGNFKAGRSQGTVLKKLCPQEEHCYNQFSRDSLAPFVPEYQGTICLDNDESKSKWGALPPLTPLTCKRDIYLFYYRVHSVTRLPINFCQTLHYGL